MTAKKRIEKGDELLRKNQNNIEQWRSEKTGIGPEPEIVPSEIECSVGASIYADDNSAGEEAKTVDELKEKMEEMLVKIFDHMRSGRLLVNSDKTKVMLFATYQKRAKNNLEFKVEVEDLKIKEVKTARLLGLEITNDFSWDNQVEETLKECSKKLNGLYKVNRDVKQEQKKL